MQTTKKQVLTNTEVLSSIDTNISEITRLLKKANNYCHAESIYKGQARQEIIDTLVKLFPYAETLNTMCLGGEDLVTENILARRYNLNSVSYEFNPKSIDKARENAPKGVDVIEGNIFNHVYQGTEQLIWFDFMTALRPTNIIDLRDWIINNPIKNDCVFAVTYTLHCRNIRGEGYRQLFDTELEHEDFINQMKDGIGMYLENEYVKVVPQVSVIRYCNTDISKKSLPMVQYIFKLIKK